MTEEMLGNIELMKIMPDTWVNVPWTVSNAVEHFKVSMMD
jgi:hypothetical protein